MPVATEMATNSTVTHTSNWLRRRSARTMGKGLKLCIMVFGEIVVARGPSCCGPPFKVAARLQMPGLQRQAAIHACKQFLFMGDDNEGSALHVCERHKQVSY